MAKKITVPGAKALIEEAKQVLSVNDAGLAKLLGVSTSSIWAWLREDRFTKLAEVAVRGLIASRQGKHVIFVTAAPPNKAQAIGEVLRALGAVTQEIK